MPGERTEQASPQRREKARRDGDILRSRELSSAAGMLAGVMCLGLLARGVLSGFRSLFAAALNQSSDRGDGATIQASILAMRKPLLEAGVPAALMMSAIVGGTVLCGLLQSGGLQISGKSLGPDLNRISPIANAKNVFSFRAAARVGKSVIPAGVLAILAYQRITHQLSLPVFSSQRLTLLGADVYGLLADTAWLMLGWALVDYAVEWRSRESRLMMSREEMKQEFKEMEGSPQTRPVTRLNNEDESSQSDAALSEFAGEALARALSQGGGFGIAERAISSLSRIGMNHILSPESETAKDLTTNP